MDRGGWYSVQKQTVQKSIVGHAAGNIPNPFYQLLIQIVFLCFTAHTTNNATNGTQDNFQLTDKKFIRK